MTSLDAVQFVGYLFIGYCAVTGAFVILRWGWCGVSILWTKRSEIDELVRSNFELSFTERKRG